MRFTSRVQMSCVAPNGVVDPRMFHVLGRWNRGCGGREGAGQQWMVALVDGG